MLPGQFDIEVPHSEYNSDKHRSLICRPPAPKGTVVLLPPRGRVSLAEAQDKENIVAGTERFVENLFTLGVERETEDVLENMVATTDLSRSPDLFALTVTLGLEATEYEPEQFLRVIHRLESAVELLFTSGKVVITQVRTYNEVMDAYEKIQNKVGNTPL